MRSETGSRSEPRIVPALIGLTFFLPGAPQWFWRQRERSLVFFGSFASSMAVGLFTWGTRTGLALVGFAYLAHVVSAADAIRQWSFPGFGRWVPTISASSSLAIGCYGPLLLVGSVVAWPGHEGGGTGAGYLVNRWAYGNRIPELGDRVWLARDQGATAGRVVEVIARPGQNVEWTPRGLRVNGRRTELVPFRSGKSPLGMEFQVPDGQLLVTWRSGKAMGPNPWELVSAAQVEGRAWARFFPVWDRRLLD